VNYGTSGSRQLLDQIHRLGTNVITVTPAQSRAIAGRARTGFAVTTLDERDYRLLKEDIPAIARSSAQVAQNYRIKAGDLSKVTSVVGCESDYFVIKDWHLVRGGLFTPRQEREGKRVAILGHNVALDLFGSASPLAATITINQIPFEVIGVLAERGQGLDVRNEDEQVFVPLTTGTRRLMNVNYYSGIVIEIAALNQMDDSAAQIRTLLHRLHHIQPGQQDDFQVQNQKSLMDLQLAASTRLNLYVRWIGLSALVVSGFGIVAIAWIALKERTREIGTRRALGATARDIFFQTALESDVLALLGGALGVLLAWPASNYISRYASLSFVFDWRSCAGAFSASILLNSLFSLLPARKAASISPIEALRYE